MKSNSKIKRISKQHRQHKQTQQKQKQMHKQTQNKHTFIHTSMHAYMHTYIHAKAKTQRAPDGHHINGGQPRQPGTGAAAGKGNGIGQQRARDEHQAGTG